MNGNRSVGLILIVLALLLLYVYDTSRIDAVIKAILGPGTTTFTVNGQPATAPAAPLVNPPTALTVPNGGLPLLQGIINGFQSIFGGTFTLTPAPAPTTPAVPAPVVAPTADTHPVAAVLTL
jgi:hypothetical protein